MKTVKVSSLIGGEIVAEDIILGNTVLIPKNTILNIEYIKSIEELGVEKVYIESTDNDVVENYLLDIITKESMKEKIRNTLEEHMYKNSLNLDRLVYVANKIIDYLRYKIKNEKLKYTIIEHNADLYEHTIQVCAIAVSIAIKLDLNEREIYNIAIGSLLHDIGLRYTTVNYKNCIIDNLSPNDIFEYKKHTIYGYIALEEIEEIESEVRNLILFHHEKLDGSGFPLKYKDLDISQRILSVCDAFESNISGMGCIRKSKEETMTLLDSVSGKEYDNNIIILIKELF
ncbi:HD-GYP domain-containing protein [Anaerosacchariphilus polymeriproducens]|uniref:HD domain-containing protein n=1 Tax=Anaerosacchariphilus polymeriproducens TaxID=1812858 RepID=A0A371AVI9_9FIRM|nr:HD domain-containing phosphohydrolase [Anaerosacchariphilus polymeriproducens]RDU23559.1 HD domain-containing protein [Anaerosacchariphilus polymeriproducens]